MSGVRDEYEHAWATFQSGPPPLDPRSQHHKRFIPDAEFTCLCRDAEQHSLSVGLKVTPGKKPLGVTGQEHRQLAAITVGLPGAERTTLEQAFDGNGLRVTSKRLREKLEALS